MAEAASVQTVTRTGKRPTRTHHIVDLEYSSAEDAPLSMLRVSQSAAAMGVSQTVAVRGAHIHEVDAGKPDSEEFTDEELEGVAELSGSEEIETSDSGNDLTVANAEAVEAELIAERPLWTAKSSSNEELRRLKAKQNLKARAAAVLPGNFEDEIPEISGDSCEDEQGPTELSAVPKPNSNKVQSSLLIASTARPSKHALQHAAEQPMWKATSATGSTVHTATSASTLPSVISPASPLPTSIPLLAPPLDALIHGEDGSNETTAPVAVLPGTPAAQQPPLDQPGAVLPAMSYEIVLPTTGSLSLTAQHPHKHDWLSTTRFPMQSGAHVTSLGP
ncbi:hypothetical protein C8Q78DRAFT_1074685 [Trametes maxima]|nr:hypothetical protein C8Q78DRAFT_1074685 [Trametes maxima]